MSNSVGVFVSDVPGRRPTDLKIMVEQGPIVLAVGEDGNCLDFFLFHIISFFLSLLLETNEDNLHRIFLLFFFVPFYLLLVTMATDQINQRAEKRQFGQTRTVRSPTIAPLHCLSTIRPVQMRRNK